MFTLMCYQKSELKMVNLSNFDDNQSLTPIIKSRRCSINKQHKINTLLILKELLICPGMTYNSGITNISKVRF